MAMDARRELRRIFDLVFELAGTAREVALARECRGDVDLERRVRAMLEAGEAGAPPPVPPEPTGGDPVEPPTAPVREGPGSEIGPYRLLERIGEGGFGVVFLAKQERPVRRTVALKVLKLGMDTRQVVARFEQERQALAMMDHPGIAKVLDAGETESGRPYFVMELVRGIPITEYCDRHRLPARDRLELFVSVCHALQHAHQKGIIHRDIKPSNVLVAERDGRPVAKIIDFGIAKATAGRLTEKTLFTEHRQLLGTPAYMSPEQAAMEGLDVDTRSDIYSLGVLLYDLLTGTTPFETKSLLEAGFAEFQRVIREVDPPMPSTRVSSLGDGLAVVAARRRAEPARLRALLCGDLDWIVMKALEKDRARRYDSASALAADLRSHLDGEPVVAAPPSALYRLRKFVRRRRGLVAAIGVVAGMLLVAVAGTGVGLLNARRSAASARAAQGTAAAQRERAERVAGFLREMLASADPEAAPGREVTVKEVLDAAAERLGASLGGEPEVEASLRHTLGESYNQLGRHRESRDQFHRALELRTSALGPDHPDTLASRFGLGTAMLQAGEVPAAREHLGATLAAQSRSLGDRHPDTMQTRSVYGFAQQLAGEPEAALRTYRDVLADQVAALGKGDRATLETMQSVADVLQDLGRLEEARSTAEELVAEARAAEGPEGPRALAGESVLVSVLTDLGRYAEAESLGRGVLAAKRRLYGENHPSTIATATVVGTALSRLERYEEATTLLARTAEASSRTLGPEHDRTLTLLGNLGHAHQLRGNLDEAERILRELVETRRRVSGETATATLTAKNNLGLLLLARERPADAEAALREVVAGIEGTLPPDHWMRGVAKVNLGRSLAGQAKCEEAEALMLAGYERLVAALPAGHERRKTAAKAVAAMYAHCGKGDLAAQWKAKE